MTVAARMSRDQTSAILLAALLGDFGLHHFLLGETSVGVLYLLFCWTGSRVRWRLWKRAA